MLFIVSGLTLFSGYLFWQYQRLPEEALNASSTFVTIIDPGSGYETNIGSPVQISARASASSSLLSVELWANDLLVGVQGAPTANGATQLPAHFLWIPSDTGIYNLRARAIGSDGQAADSDVVWVFVRANSFTGEEADILVPAASGGGAGEPPSDEIIAQMPPPAPYTPPAPPAPSEPPKPAEVWSPDLSGFLTWLSPPLSAPVTPQLTASVEACKVTLNIHDLSENELGFKLYRTQLGETQNSVPTYTLAPQPGQGWLSFEDNLTQASTYTYVMEAFNGLGSSGPSNPVTIDALASGCPPPEAPPMNSLELISLKTQFPAAEQAYCYISRNGMQWYRFPAVGFLPAGEAGSFELQGKISDLFIEVVGEEEEQSVPPTTYWDCWGWPGGELSQLGVFQVDLALTPDGPKTIKDAANLAELVFSFGTLTTKEGDIGLWDLGSDIQDTIAALDPTATDTQLLAPTLHYSTSPADCEANLPGNANPNTCHPHIYYFAKDTHTHPYLYWDLNNKDNCADPGNCTDMDELSYFPYSVSDQGYHLYDLQWSATVPIKTYHGFDEHLYVVHTYKGSCGKLRTFEVRTFVELDQTFTYESSSPAAVQTFAQPCNSLDKVLIKVEFTALDLADVDDGWFDDDIEIYGDFYVTPSYNATFGNAVHGNMGGWGTAAGVDGCSLEGIEAYGQPSKAGWECPLSYGNETVTQFGMCRTNFSPDLCATSYSPVNQVFHIYTMEGDNQILVSIALFDYDYQSANDPVCVGSVWMTKEPHERWIEAINYRIWHFYQGDNGNASCTAWWRTTVHEP